MTTFAFCGFIGSGKDTAADYLVDTFNFTRQSFAGPLKDAVSAVFGWDREMLEGRTKEARECREQVDPWWATRLGMPQLTPRLVLQQWGTEVCRNGFHDDIWIASFENKMRTITTNVVISDARFPNEFGIVHNAGGKVIRIKRGLDPEWYNDAVAANIGDTNAYSRMIERGIHRSEWAWLTDDIDITIDNNGTIEQLMEQVNHLITY